MFTKKKLLGVDITIGEKKEILEYIIRGLEKLDEKYYVVTPNPEILVIADRDPYYKKVLNNAKVALPDGIGVIIASKLLGFGLKDRVTGVDLMKSLCMLVSEKPITIGLLGAGPGVAELAAECLTKKYPGLKVVLAKEEWDKYNVKLRLNKTNKNERRIDILFVAFGSPKQEIWIYENLNKLPIGVAIGVGGAFDFISGKVRRAPLFLQKIGLEWLFRLITQPWRIKRQFSLIKFIALVIFERFKTKNN
ncbi:MAG TPA: WecB/TagA/CpsF family glycosyltransferase [Patescibacteria group bacterium]|nr:WecB/TagA/CpsF family glycosyltransferase [Patescibacteria group bacterium]